MIYYIILYHIILYYIILYYIILYYIISYYFISYYIILYYNFIGPHRICGPSLTATSLCYSYLYLASCLLRTLNKQWLWKMKHAAPDIRAFCARLDDRRKKSILSPLLWSRLFSSVAGSTYLPPPPRSRSLITKNFHALSLLNFQAPDVHRIVKSGRA
jgi:hypothetical protein